VFATNSNLDVDLDIDTTCYHDMEGVCVRYFAHVEPLKRAFPRVRYVSQSMGFLYAPDMARELDRVVPSIDIVHTHLPFVYPTLAAGRAAIRHHRPLVYHQRGVFDPRRLNFRSLKKRAYLQLVELPVVRRASVLIALTAAEVDSYARLGLDVPCRVIPNGIDAMRFSVRAEPEWLTPLGISDSDVVVLFLSRIHPIKGADRLLDAFERIHAAHPSAKLVLAGPDEFALEASFRARAGAAGLAGRVVFPGMVYGRLKEQLLARADLFVLPSDAEGFSMAILEALASSTCVLVSPGCHFPEVEAAGAGRVVEADAASLADALGELLSDRARLRQMGEAGRRLVLTHYSWQSVTDQMLQAYDQAIEVQVGR
jgi:glycosyltransferase involved in cell wall biosynthesis